MNISQTIKTLILEYLAGNGASHIREIHLHVKDIRKNVPQHTIRSRLSELSRNRNLEEKLQSFGNGFYGLYDENQNMTSVVSYPDRGPLGRCRVSRELFRPFGKRPDFKV